MMGIEIVVQGNLTFVKNDAENRYDSKFEVIAAVYDEDENQVAARVVSRDLYVEDYDLTNSREDRIQLTRALDLPQGAYMLKLRVTDLISKKTMSRNIEFDLANMSGEDLAVSDILFINDLEVDSST